MTIAFLTLFMLLEGPAWVERFYSLLPPEKQPRWRKIGHDIYRTIGGYVTGNLAISLIAGITSTAVLLVLGVPYAVALGLLVAILDLVPLAGATIAAVIVTTVAFTLDDLGDRRADLLRSLSATREPRAAARRLRANGPALPLVVLIAVLIGAEIAGVIGALAAIPVAGTVQVLIVDWLSHRRARGSPDPTPTTV